MVDTDQPIETREEEFLALFAASQRPLHAYILALVFDPNTAADILQETNITLWQKFDQFQSGTNFFAWSREVARLAVLRHRQKTSSRIACMDPSSLESLATRFSDSVASASQNRAAALDECLSLLHPSDKQLILARYAPGASVSELAEGLKRTANSVSQSLSRIRRSLLECTQRRLKSAGRE